MGDRVALLRRTFGEEVVCPDCGGRLRLIALVKKEETIQTLLSAMQLLTQATGPPGMAKSELPDSDVMELERRGKPGLAGVSGLIGPIPCGGRVRLE